MKIALFQYSPVWEDVEANEEIIRTEMSAGITDENLVIFPEMTLTGFTMKANDFAEDASKELEFFTGLAKEFNINVLAGIIEKSNDDFFNALCHINPKGELVNKYRKIHPFSHSEEEKYFKRGENPVVTNIDDWKIGLSVCYDLRFPELYRLYGKERVDLIVNIANWPVTRIEHWRTLCKARAIENQCYVAGVNRVGSDPKLKYNGYSCVIDPMGNEIVSQPDKQAVLAASLSKRLVDETRTSLPFLNDMYLI